LQTMAIFKVTSILKTHIHKIITCRTAPIMRFYFAHSAETLKTQNPSSYPEYSVLSATNVRRLFVVTIQAKDYNTGALLWAINNISSTADSSLSETRRLTRVQEQQVDGLYPSLVPSTYRKACPWGFQLFQSSVGRSWAVCWL
jgi:hypothetical protein